MSNNKNIPEASASGIFIYYRRKSVVKETIEEGDYLRPRAARVGRKGRFGRALRYAVLKRPGYR